LPPGHSQIGQKDVQIVAWAMALDVTGEMSLRCPSQETRGYHMKKLAYLVSVSLFAAGSAVAADMRMPTKAPPPAPPPPAFNWTGCYVGAGGGYGMFKQKTREIDPFGVSFLSHDNGGDGWFGTVQVGCDLQVGGGFLIGAFGDFDFGNNIRGDVTIPVGTLTGFSGVGREKIKHTWAAGGRIGWVPWSQTQFLFYVSGGFTQVKFDQVDFVDAELGGLIGDSILSRKRNGWFVGTGYEYGIQWFLPGLFWKTEYRFAEYDNKTLDIVDTTTRLPTGFAVDSEKRIQTIRSELVWRFNWSGGGAPVAARY
jgi:outer membrane immunogenic protein